MKPLRIAMVAACPFPCPRGTPLRVEKMAGALAARGHEVHVVTYHLGFGEPPAGVRVHRTRALPIRSALAPGPTASKLAILDPLLARLLRRVLDTNAIDVIHAHHYEGLAVSLAATYGASRARLRAEPRAELRVDSRVDPRATPREPGASATVMAPARPPLVYDAHTLLASELPDYDFARPRAVARGVGAFIDRRMPRRATHVVAVTERLRARLIAEFGVAPACASVVPNGVEREFLEACAAAPARVRGETLVFSGNFAAYQGVDIMLEAFDEVARARPAARLVILSSESASRLRPRLAGRGAIEFAECGPRDLPARLAAADVALSPRPRADGLPMKILNYMAAGLPTVAFREAAGPLDDGETGLLVDEPTPAAFARAILRLFDDRALADRLGRAARATVATRYTWESVSERLEAIYAALLSAPAGGS